MKPVQRVPAKSTYKRGGYTLVYIDIITNDCNYIWSGLLINGKHKLEKVNMMCGIKVFFFHRLE